VEKLERDSLIPSVLEVRERLSRNLEEARLLRRQLRISEDAAADEYARRARNGQISGCRKEPRF
jgi:hypothetical protein